MIEIIDKDILTVDQGIICHQVNCFGVMGGLAGAIAHKWPMVREQYIQQVTYYANDLNRRWDMLGAVDYVVLEKSTLIVANLFAQYDYGTESRKTEYGSLRQCFYNVWTRARNEHLDVYIPHMMGCGLAGGDWNIVYSMIEKYFERSMVNVFICKKP